jgi:Sel1 repeat-containing protein
MRMKENYCLGDDGSDLCSLRGKRKTAHKNLNRMVVILFIILGLTAGTCWWSDQALTQARAMQGDPEAEYTVGKRCLDRARTPQECARAVDLVRNAAEQGNPRAQTGLGILYLKGLGVPRDNAAGVKWLHAAASRNFVVAQNELGVMYATGQGMPRDLDAAIFWCAKAADQGSRIARKNLELIETAKRNHNGKVTTRNGDLCLNLKIQKVESDGVMVTFEPEKGGLGFAKFKTANLPRELQKLCGYTATAPSKLSALLHLDAFASTL